MTEESRYFVEGMNGGYDEDFSFEEACKVAETDSIERSCLMMVRYQYGYIPVVIYHSGHVYKPLDQSGA